MSTGSTGSHPTPNAGVIKVITLGTDQYVIAKLDKQLTSGIYDVEIDIDATAQGAGVPALGGGCFKVSCGHLTIIV